MSRKSIRVSFPNADGDNLVGILERSQEPPRAFALFSHCFTCGKDLKSIVRISRQLAQRGWGVLRFDFTGLYHSSGDFSATNLTTNVSDIHAAAAFMWANYQAPQLLIGHSLGGTAMALAANQVDSAKALVTIASPGSTDRLARFLETENPSIQSQGVGSVSIGGRQYELRRQLLEDLRSYEVEQVLSQLRVPILMFHSPQDQTLPYAMGLKMFGAAVGRKSFVTLDGADHLLTNQPLDIEFVAETITVWARRYCQR